MKRAEQVEEIDLLSRTRKGLRNPKLWQLKAFYCNEFISERIPAASGVKRTG